LAEVSMIRLFLASAILLLVASAAAADEGYDLLIRGGRIVDGTGNPWFVGDVAIRGDKIVAVGRVREEQAERTIDAKGLVVVPGFIDMHSHSDYLLLEDGDAQSKIRQGVTTEVLGEGTSPGPFRRNLGPRAATIGGKRVLWDRLAGYFSALEEVKISVNVACY